MNLFSIRKIMKIVRRGASANHGTSEINLSLPTFEWTKSKSCLSIKQDSVKDFSTTSHHAYRIEISAQELVRLFDSLAFAAQQKESEVGTSLGPALKSILQLQYAAAGLLTKQQVRDI